MYIHTYLWVYVPSLLSTVSYLERILLILVECSWIVLVWKSSDTHTHTSSSLAPKAVLHTLMINLYFTDHSICVQLPDTRNARTTTATWAICVQLLDTGGTAQARLPYRGKEDWQPNNFCIFLSSIHIISLLNVYSHFSRIPSLLLYTSLKFINCCMIGYEACIYALRMPSTIYTLNILWS